MSSRLNGTLVHYFYLFRHCCYLRFSVKKQAIDASMRKIFHQNE